ncbi:MAG: hypothetical protein ABH887_00335 [bacterium]
MKRFVCFLGIVIVIFSGCARQTKLAPVIQQPVPRVIVYRVPAEKVQVSQLSPNANLVDGLDYESQMYPNPCRGYIKNEAWPFFPKVWLIKNGKMICLICSGEFNSPPDIYDGEVREVVLPPGQHVLHVERWQRVPTYRHPNGWLKQPKPEVVEVEVKAFSTSDEVYGWRIVIGPTYTSVYDY